MPSTHTQEIGTISNNATAAFRYISTPELQHRYLFFKQNSLRSFHALNV